MSEPLAYCQGTYTLRRWKIGNYILEWHIPFRGEIKVTEWVSERKLNPDLRAQESFPEESFLFCSVKVELAQWQAGPGRRNSLCRDSGVSNPITSRKSQDSVWLERNQEQWRYVELRSPARVISWEPSKFAWTALVRSGYSVRGGKGRPNEQEDQVGRCFPDSGMKWCLPPGRSRTDIQK